MAAAPKINAEPSFRDIDRSVLRVMEPAGRAYWAWVGFCFTLVAIAAGFWLRQIYSGLGVTGLAQPVMWAIYITNFVFWVGIAHSGTLISAVLFLFRTKWRTAVYRAAETMTIFAVATAGLFPLVHLGRVWFFYWLLPYPNERSLQPDFRSPLVWDAFAVSTYLTISALFWTMGLLPDIANAREAATGWRKKFYTVLAMGWQGTDRQWRHYSMAYLLMAGLATPLVLSVHSVVSWDFAMAINPGWHSTIFAPYFVAGAIFSGVAMVITLLIPMRRLLGIEDLLTEWHFDTLAKVVLLTGAAGRDERAFEDPDHFDIHRRTDLHLSFGYGIHYCLGAALARMEGRIALEETLRRFPIWEVDRARAVPLYTSTVRGYLELPITV